MISLDGPRILTGPRSARHPAHLCSPLARWLDSKPVPGRRSRGLYHTADATLWFFHAIDRYVTVTNDGDTLRDLLPALDEVVQKHRAGTRFGIRMDDDGLLTQGAENLALTWMDAKVGEWVVTPRRGKTVEINALWYALRLLAHWNRSSSATAPNWMLSRIARARRSTAGSGLRTANISLRHRRWGSGRRCLAATESDLRVRPAPSRAR